ncbi:sulfotransferase 1B1-like [Watersipora subatra]|uniref:sulfotransferase 1B1-like n=1 Tax=Watersipora subatra TaxID=2589382 RepID=UPI00355BC55F
MDDRAIPVHPRGGTVRKQFFTSDDGSVQVPASFIDEAGLSEVREAYNTYKWREEDILLASYPKTGTHFVWEILTMLLKGSSTVTQDSKNLSSIDIFPVTKMDEVYPSPRVLNTHYRLDVLPSQFRNRKTVLVLRNPKDVCVSFYHQDKNMVKLNLDGWDSSPLSTYLRMFLLSKDMPAGNYFDYAQYMWSLRHDPNKHLVFYEDLIMDPVGEIEKLNKFMGTQRPAELIQQIADATNFSKMKQDKVHCHQSKPLQDLVGADGKMLEKAMGLLFRKGKIGDWKNHFTVAENDMFDSFLQQWTAGHDIPFKYE